MEQQYLLICALAILTAALSTREVESSCTGGCTCSRDSADNSVVASCKLATLDELLMLISRPLQVKSLVISSSELLIIPKRSFINFTNLVMMSLAFNKIQSIEAGAFSTLSNLQHLNLSGNQLIEWHAGNLSDELSSLMYLDLAGNPSFKPPSHVLKLRKLKQIKGSSWSDACVDCVLDKNYVLQNDDLKGDKININTSELQKEEYLVGNKAHCRLNNIQVSPEVAEFAKNGFFPRCLETNTKCFNSEIKVTPIHRCWDLDNKILNIAYLISPPAIVLNLIVVFVTLTTAALRRNVALLLASNMAASDFLISLYTLILISFRKMAYTEFLVVIEGLCKSIGFIWLTGQIVSINTSLLLTIERFVVIIYCMKPNVRMTRKIALACASAAWLIAVSVATLPLVKISVYTSNTYCVPVRPIRDIPHSFELSIGLALWAMFLYLSTIPLYIKIYLAVKMSGQRIGVKRDGALAKRIAILVLSNMAFFFVPIVVAFIWLVTDLAEHMSPQSREILTGVFGTLCLSFNSFLNPLLYAFRVEKFKKAFLMKINTICLRKARGQSMSQSQSNARQRGPTVSSTDGGNQDHVMASRHETKKRPGSLAFTKI